MTSRSTSLLARLSGTVSIALLALGFGLGGTYAARAEEPEAMTPAPTLNETIVVPIMQAVGSLEQRLVRLEESMAELAASYTQRVVSRQICLADDAGAETCITKAQLDGLLQRLAKAETSEPQVTVAILADPQPSTSESPAADSPIAAESSAADLSAADLPVAEPVETAPATEVTLTELDGAARGEAEAAQEPVYTGSTVSEADGAALVTHPNIEVTVAVEGCLDN